MKYLYILHYKHECFGYVPQESERTNKESADAAMVISIGNG